MAQINSPRKTRSGKVLGGAGAAIATVEEIIREPAEDVIDLTEHYIDVDAYDEDATGNLTENRTVVEVIVEDDDDGIIIEDGVGENGLNANHSSINNPNRIVDLTNSPSPKQKKPNISPSFPIGASCSSFASTAPSNGFDSVSCRICLDSQSDLEKEGHHLLSTVCGHIFCSKCLPNYINKRGLCPICRRVLRPKDFHPIFL